MIWRDLSALWIMLLKGQHRNQVVTYHSGFNCARGLRGVLWTSRQTRWIWMLDLVGVISLSAYAIEAVRFCKLSTQTVGRVQMRITRAPSPYIFFLRTHVLAIPSRVPSVCSCYVGFGPLKVVGKVVKPPTNGPLHTCQQTVIHNSSHRQRERQGINHHVAATYRLL